MQFRGAERQAYLLAGLLADRLGACEVVTSQPDAYPQRSGVYVRRIGTPHQRTWSQAINFGAAFSYFARNGHRYSIVHGHCLSAFVLGALLGAKLRGCRTVVKLCAIGRDGDISKILARRFGIVMWRLFAGTDLFIAPTPEIAPELRRAGVPDRKIVVVPNFVTPCDCAALEPSARAVARAVLGLPEQPTVLFAARWVAQKRVEFLLQAWDLLAPRNATLVLVGDGPEEQRILQWMRQSPAAASVRVVAWQTDMRPFYRAADIFAFPARDEAFGNVIAEAMAYGLAVITTRAGLAQNWIRDGESGIIVSDDEPAPMAAALESVITDAARRRRLGAAAREVVAKHFAPDVVLETLLNAYAAPRTNELE